MRNFGASPGKTPTVRFQDSLLKRLSQPNQLNTPTPNIEPTLNSKDSSLESPMPVQAPIQKTNDLQRFRKKVDADYNAYQPNQERKSFVKSIQDRLNPVAEQIANPAQEHIQNALAANNEIVQRKSIINTASQFLGAPSVPEDGSATGIVGTAKKYLGIPYKWGGTNPQTGLDCSGLVQLVYKQHGVQLPRVSADQAKVGRPVTLDQAQPGDLVASPSRGLPVGHIGIYVGNGQMLHAPRRGQPVQISPIPKRIATIRRVVG